MEGTDEDREGVEGQIKRRAANKGRRENEGIKRGEERGRTSCKVRRGECEKGEQS